MNAIHDALSDFAHFTVLEKIGWLLVQSLWQETLVAGALLIVLACLRSRSAQTRYVAACAAMAAMAVIPLLTWLLAANVVASNTAEPAPSPVITLLNLAVPGASQHESDARPAPASERTLPNILEAASCSWLLGLVGLSAWNLVGWLRVRDLRVGSAAASAAWQEKLAKLSKLIGCTNGVAIRVTRRISTPAVVGWVRPMVLIPASALTELPAEQLEALLLHELAHVRRFDYLVNLVQTAVETLLFYHPAVWWCGSVIRAERENCCDDIAAKYCGSKFMYARALAAMEQLRSPALPAWAVAATGGKLLGRIERLVGTSSQRRREKGVRLGLALPVLVAAVTLLGFGWRHSTAQPMPTTIPATQPAPIKTVQPEDLVAGPPTDYKISPEDMIAIQIAGLTAPNTETLRQARVSQTGSISMPYLDAPIRIEALTDFQAEQAIRKAYADAGLIAHAAVSVTVVEARGNSFNILGNVAAPGTYPIARRNFRLLDAIAAAGGSTDPGTIRILRHQPGEPERTIQLPGDKLLAGDASLNIVVRPHDAILLRGVPTPSDLVVRGILREGERYSLNVDGKWVGEGDVIESDAGRIEIQSIAFSRIVIVRNGSERIVQVGESLKDGKPADHR